MKVLVIEDNITVRRMIIRLLRRMFDDARVEAAAYADEAITLIMTSTLDRPYDLVISDFNLLGGRTGGDVLAWVREHASYLEPRFLFFTSDDRAAKLHKNYVEKSHDTTELRMTIETMLNKSQS